MAAPAAGSSDNLVRNENRTPNQGDLAEVGSESLRVVRKYFQHLRSPNEDSFGEKCGQVACGVFCCLILTTGCLCCVLNDCLRMHRKVVTHITDGQVRRASSALIQPMKRDLPLHHVVLHERHYICIDHLGKPQFHGMIAE